MRRAVSGLVLFIIVSAGILLAYRALQPEVKAITSPFEQLATPTQNGAPPLETIDRFDLHDAIELAQRGVTNLDAHVIDYSAKMVKQERIGTQLTEVNELFVKIQNPGKDSSGKAVRPLRVYLKFLKPDHVAGREVIWCEDRYDQKLMAHEAGFLGILTVALDPHGPIAMMGNRHPISHIGLAYLMDELIRYGNQAPVDADLSVQKFDDHDVSGTKCRLIRIESNSPAAGLGFSRIDIAVDMEKLIPVHLSTYDWPPAGEQEPQLIESYTYYDVVLNPGLSDLDFDTKNPDYKFP